MRIPFGNGGGERLAIASRSFGGSLQALVHILNLIILFQQSIKRLFRHALFGDYMVLSLDCRIGFGQTVRKGCIRLLQLGDPCLHRTPLRIGKRFCGSGFRNFRLGCLGKDILCRFVLRLTVKDRLKDGRLALRLGFCRFCRLCRHSLKLINHNGFRHDSLRCIGDPFLGQTQLCDDRGKFFLCSDIDAVLISLLGIHEEHIVILKIRKIPRLAVKDNDKRTDTKVRNGNQKAVHPFNGTLQAVNTDSDHNIRHTILNTKCRKARERGADIQKDRQFLSWQGKVLSIEITLHPIGREGDPSRLLVVPNDTAGNILANGRAAKITVQRNRVLHGLNDIVLKEVINIVFGDRRELLVCKLLSGCGNRKSKIECECRCSGLTRRRSHGN